MQPNGYSQKVISLLIRQHKHFNSKFMASAVGVAFVITGGVRCFSNRHHHQSSSSRALGAFIRGSPLLALGTSASALRGISVAPKTGGGAEGEGHEFPDEFYDEEWQAKQREKTKEWQAYRRKEEETENRKLDEYREIGLRLKGYPEEEVRKAKKLVSGFIRAAEEVEEKIEEAGDKGELTELVLMVIWNRLDLARRDDEKDAIRSLDLLYRRVETEILKRESSPSMRLLNELLNLHDGYDDEAWLKKCRKRMIDIFPPEDPFSILVPTGFDIHTHQGRIQLPEDSEDILLRIDFIREVNELLQEVRDEQNIELSPSVYDPESVAHKLKQLEKQRTIHQVESLLELAVNLNW